MSISNVVIKTALRENRQFLIENLGETSLLAADYIFEHGFLTRADYNAIDCILSKTNRSKKLIDILENKDNKVLDILISYLEKEVGTGNSALVQRLKNSRAKYSLSLQLPGEKPMASQSPVKSTSTSVNDFSMTSKEANAARKIISQHEFAIKRWAEVVVNMNAFDVEDINSILEMQRRNESWDHIVADTLMLWIEKTGKNATFFSLLGVLQEAQLYNTADLLLDNKDEIQNAK